MATDDIAIVPTGSKLYERPIRVVPVYLVLIEDPSVKAKFAKFIATKLDETSAMVKMVGIDTNHDVSVICESYQDILNSTDKSLYREITLPMQRIIRIQNLIFKQK